MHAWRRSLETSTVRKSANRTEPMKKPKFKVKKKLCSKVKFSQRFILFLVRFSWFFSIYMEKLRFTCRFSFWLCSFFGSVSEFENFSEEFIPKTFVSPMYLGFRFVSIRILDRFADFGTIRALYINPQMSSKNTSVRRSANRTEPKTEEKNEPLTSLVRPRCVIWRPLGKWGGKSVIFRNCRRNYISGFKRYKLKMFFDLYRFSTPDFWNSIRFSFVFPNNFFFEN